MTRAASLLLLLLTVAAANAGTLRGRVTDPGGAALAGVVVEIGTRVAISDERGEYAIEVDDGRAEVAFRLLNFASIVKTVAVPSTLDVTLTPETSASIVVTGTATFRNLADLGAADLLGFADAASAGVVTAAQLETRALQRPGDVLESVPGVVVSQHSGAGKANQYYLRGFNLDHGTDLATTVAGVPVNLPTHAHGQGYTDVNFLIPELITGVQYKKGPYYADEGDFASAGAVNVNYANWLEKPIVSLTAGRFGYERALAAGSRAIGSHSMLLGALEVSRNDGPWVRPDDFRKFNGLLRFTTGRGADALSVTLSGYDGRWSATDQIPSRARAVLTPFGHVDATNGGATHRYALSAEWERRNANASTRASVYGLTYALDLFSNFTYFLDDPVNGDQFEQEDERVVFGGKWSRQWTSSRFEHRAGIDARHDRIGVVGLHRTRERARLATIREDAVEQTSAGVYAQTTARWTPMLRSVIGLRADALSDAHIASPKVSLVLGPWRSTELYLSAGSGFHSNDARGGSRASSPLARTRGAELGLRSFPLPRWQTTVAVWALDIESELVFVGDAGTTEERGASRRAGIEWTNYWRVSDRVVVDADFAWSRARFRTGDHVPGAVEGVVAGGISLVDCGRWSGSLRGRWLGARPLVEDDTVRSDPSTLASAEVAYAVTPRVRLAVEAVNLFDARGSDIEYVYTSRLPGEPAHGMTDRHTHPLEPRSLRVTVRTTF